MKDYVITFEKAYELLEDAVAVIFDDEHSSAQFPILFDDEDNPFFLSLGEEPNELYFRKEDNLFPELVDSSLFLKESGGDEIQITLLKYMFPSETVDPEN